MRRGSGGAASAVDGTGGGGAVEGEADSSEGRSQRGEVKEKELSDRGRRLHVSKRVALGWPFKKLQKKYQPKYCKDGMQTMKDKNVTV
jgi:hypothetical protein